MVDKPHKYDTSGLVEGQFEPGSRGRVLKNLLGIRKKREMDSREGFFYFVTLINFLEHYAIDHRFSAKNICFMHKEWLRNIYPWAGQYRNVNISKGGFPFAAAQHIPKMMAEFEAGPLREFTPCRFSTHDEIAKAIAIVHVELVLIHPFREGNGRVARMLAVLMALQAGLPLLDFRDIKGKKRLEYFTAVQAGLSRNYVPMACIFKSVIARTMKEARKSEG